VPHGDSLPSYDELAQYAPDASLYAAAPSPTWLNELDLKPAPPHLKMGTHSLDVATWLSPDHFRNGELDVKRRLFADRPEAVFACLSHADDAAHEAAYVVAEWMRVHAGVNVDWSVHPHPLAAVSLHVQEDLALMVFREVTGTSTRCRCVFRVFGDCPTRSANRPVPCTARCVTTKTICHARSTISSHA